MFAQTSEGVEERALPELATVDEVTDGDEALRKTTTNGALDVVLEAAAPENEWQPTTESSVLLPTALKNSFTPPHVQQT